MEKLYSYLSGTSQNILNNTKNQAQAGTLNNNNNPQQKENTTSNQNQKATQNQINLNSQSEKKIQKNKIKNRLLMLSPTVREGLERECGKDDFFSEGDKAIGKGAFGQVWKVRHKKTDKIYVIKVMNKQNIIEQRMAEHINLEVEILYKISHPHIIKLYNHFEDDDNIYLVMQYAAKGQLYTHLKKQGRFDQRTTAQYMRELLSAIRHLHSFNPPIIHRDIKPENILLDESGRIKLADFGWSNYEEHNKRTTYCGTPEYLAPEMIKKEGHDTMVDIWDIGVLMFELLTGKPPFSGSNQNELLSNIKKNKIVWPDDFPPLAKNLIFRILKLNPKERIGLDEILAHAWFEKNPPLRPVLTESITDPKAILESNLINTKLETVKEEINKIVEITQKKRQSILESSNAEIKKLQMQNSNNTKNEDFKAEYNPIKDEHGSPNGHVLTGLNISEVLKCNEILTSEITDIKMRYEKCDQENKNLRNENIKLKENFAKQSTLGVNDSEFLKLKEELDKYRIVNSDRIDLLAQIEEKNNEILELKKKLNFYENEQELAKRNAAQTAAKATEMEALCANNETKFNEMKIKIEELIKEKNDMVIQNQNKIEILQAKLFNFDSQSDGNSEDKIHNTEKILEMIYENLHEFETLFKKVVANLEKNFIEIQETAEKSNRKISEIIDERHASIIEVFDKTKLVISEELIKFKNKIEDDSKNNKITERIDWMKKQINELMNYKVKSTNLEESLKKTESQNKKLEEMIELYKYNAETLQKVNVEKEEKITSKEKYIRNLEARLSDVKDYMFQNHLDKIEEMSKWYKF